MKTYDPLWFHVDMDAFYSAVEQRDNPEYRNKPVIVGAKPGSRGVVSTCSYEARAFGIHSAMPINTAYELCPDGIYLPPRIAYYSEVSKQIMDRFEDFSPDVTQVSIDEAFINMTGTEGIWGSAGNSARLLKEGVKESSGLTISVGVAANRLVAKMASDFMKPDGLTIVERGREEEFIAGLSLDSLWGVGKKTRQRLEELNINSIEQLRIIPQETLQRFFGEATGTYLFRVVRGINPGMYEGLTKNHSISNEHTFSHDCSDRQQITDTLFNLAYSIVFRLHQEHALSRTLVLKLRLSNFSTSTIQKTVGHNIRTVEGCYDLATELLEKKWDQRTPVRLLGLGFARVEKEEELVQSDLFDLTTDKRYRVEEAVLSLQEKYGGIRLSKARNLSPKKDQGSEN